MSLLLKAYSPSVIRGHHSHTLRLMGRQEPAEPADQGAQGQVGTSHLGRCWYRFFYLSWKPGEGLAQAIEQLFPECVGKSTKLGRLGRCCLEQGGQEGGSQPDHDSKGKGSPLAHRAELGSHGRGHTCPQPKTGWEGSILPPHGLLYSSQQPCQINDIPIFQTGKLRPRKIQCLCPKLQCRWHSWRSGLVPSTAPRLAPNTAMVTMCHLYPGPVG